MVSVPWVMTTPSLVLSASCAARASARHSSGCTLLESRVNTSRARTGEGVAGPSARSRSAAPSVGSRPFLPGVHAMVPPVASKVSMVRPSGGAAERAARNDGGCAGGAGCAERARRGVRG